MENIEQQRRTKLTFPITLPITINAVSATTFLPITVTADSITATGQWSPLFPNLDPSFGPKIMSLTLPTRLTFPTTITIATNAFTAATTVTSSHSLFNIFINNEPHHHPPPPPHSHSGYHHDLTSTESITTLPIILTLILELDNSNNDTKPVGFHFTIFDNLITIDAHPLLESSVGVRDPSVAAVVLMANTTISVED
ncbi:hypothetical protein Lal_00003495 [Lupinus albus]|nr:hypothetical protein Lal_00003495 [Lupinus albus]